MNSISLGIILGVVFGAIAVIPMTKMGFTDKRAAITGAFINRFAVGFLIPNALSSVDPIPRGLPIGIVLSLPDAIITKAYAPIMSLDVIGGLVIGIIIWLVNAA
jgi:hypothetical protein